MAKYAKIEACREHLSGSNPCTIVGGLHMQVLSHSWISPDYCQSHGKYCDPQKGIRIETIEI